MNCDKCGTTMKQLFFYNSLFCPNECDLKSPTPTNEEMAYFSLSIEAIKRLVRQFGVIDEGRIFSFDRDCSLEKARTDAKNVYDAVVCAVPKSKVIFNSLTLNGVWKTTEALLPNEFTFPDNPEWDWGS